jgi:nucleoid-associated protein YgaU
MTRENKVALVVGFALVLFVGILISDHLSDAQTRRSADLAPPAARTAATAGRAGARLLDLRQEPRRRTDAGPAAPTPGTAAPSVRPVSQPRPAAPRPTAAPPAGPEPEAAAPAAAAPPEAPRHHDVRPGETLSVIAQRYYGSVRFTEALAAFNGLDDPDDLWAGRRLRVPPPQELTGPRPDSGAAAPAAPEAPDAAPAYASYRIRPGDSLSVLAARFLDSAGRWRDLYELNRDVIDDPDDIRVGSVIRVPAAAGG